MKSGKLYTGKVVQAVICLSLFIFHFSFVPAQNLQVDSLQNVLKMEKNDTGKVNTLNTLCEKLERIGKYEPAIICSDSAWSLAEKLGFKNGLARAFRNGGSIYDNEGNFTKALEFVNKALSMEQGTGNKSGETADLCLLGTIYNDQGNYPKALDYDFKALALGQETGDKNNTARTLGNLGTVYYNQGNYPRAIEYHLKALAIDKEIANNTGVAADLCNLGNVYYDQANYPKAIENYENSLTIEQEIGNKEGIATDLGNLGNVNDNEGNYSKALEYDLKALVIVNEIGDKAGVARNLGNIGNIYVEQHNYAMALENYGKALTIYRENKDDEGIARTFASMGFIYAKQKNYYQAKTSLDSALYLSKHVGEKYDIEYVYSYMAVLDSATGNFKKGYEDYKSYIIYRDSLVNEANTKKTVQTEMNYEFEQKQAAEKAGQDKKDAIAEQERNKQKVIRNSFMAGFVLMIALAFFIFRGYRQKQKANTIIIKQKEEVEKQKLLVEQQKAIVDEKNKDITDSIHYASRIQRALLTTDGYISQYLKEYFILFKPRDIVSGDFYWAFGEQSSVVSGQSSVKTFHIACCDCTGHGVPGAFMSLLNISMLNETVVERNITRPDLVLNDIRANIIKALNPSGSDTESKDGMDCSYCSIDMENKILYSACANNPVWIIGRDATHGAAACNELPPDKMPVGIQYGEQKPFTLQSTRLHEGDCVYLFTDGYADQFGGPKGKKFKYKQLQQLIMDNCQLTMAEQKKILDETIEKWKGGLEQVDDILIIGIRV
ncbi:MAG: tetratricopeptide repeat protein [Bacteroidia bacterium]